MTFIFKYFEKKKKKNCHSCDSIIKHYAESRAFSSKKREKNQQTRTNCDTVLKHACCFPARSALGMTRRCCMMDRKTPKQSYSTTEEHIVEYSCSGSERFTVCSSLYVCWT